MRSMIMNKRVSDPMGGAVRFLRANRFEKLAQKQKYEIWKKDVEQCIEDYTGERFASIVLAISNRTEKYIKIIDDIKSNSITSDQYKKMFRMVNKTAADDRQVLADVQQELRANMHANKLQGQCEYASLNLELKDRINDLAPDKELMIEYAKRMREAKILAESRYKNLLDLQSSVRKERWFRRFLISGLCVAFGVYGINMIVIVTNWFNSL